MIGKITKGGEEKRREEKRREEKRREEKRREGKRSKEKRRDGAGREEKIPAGNVGYTDTDPTLWRKKETRLYPLHGYPATPGQQRG